MGEGTSPYPRHDQLKEYFQAYARHFDLYTNYRFGSTIIEAKPEKDSW